MNRTPHTPCRTPRTPRKRKLNENHENDSLHVYCRLRPVDSIVDPAYKLVSLNTVELIVPESSNLKYTSSEFQTQYTFKRVFPEETLQKEIFTDIAYPLVVQLVEGQNGLLFTYGVTGSGKTHTMTGSQSDWGIMPRCLEVLFNSISEYQRSKFIFKPDTFNGFDIQSEADAARDWARYVKLNKTNSYEDLTCHRTQDDLSIIKISKENEDNVFAVFVTYVEIYNDNVYDLLDRSDKKQLKIRQDKSGNSYVSGVTEVEVQNTEEAVDVFNRGQKGRKMACTKLNADSSRSHSVFTIRVVKAPLDANGESVLQCKDAVIVSQLSLVDLAGVERTKRTGNQGERLKEAGNINNSLMGLRQCLEALRRNQRSGMTDVMIPSRDYKLTYLFNIFFKGEGSIRMIMCVNPKPEEFEENCRVMQFAEVSQEILTRPTPAKAQTPGFLTPGRRRLNLERQKKLEILKEVSERDESAPFCTALRLMSNIPKFPVVDFDRPEYHQELRTCLKERRKRRAEAIALVDSAAEKFRLELQEQVTDKTCQMENAKEQAKRYQEALMMFSSQSNSVKQCKYYEKEVVTSTHVLEKRDAILCGKSKEKRQNEKENHLKATQSNQSNNRNQEKLTLHDPTPKKMPRLNENIRPDTEANTTMKTAPRVVLPKIPVATFTPKAAPFSMKKYGNESTPGGGFERQARLKPILKRKTESVTSVTTTVTKTTTNTYGMRTRKQRSILQDQDMNQPTVRLSKIDTLPTYSRQVTFEELQPAKKKNNTVKFALSKLPLDDETLARDSSGEQV